MWPEEMQECFDPDKFTVIRDSREPKERGWHWLPDDRCNGTIIENLKTGDYTLKGFEDRLCIERKASASEIAHNLTESRFPAFCERFSKFEHAYIVAECSFQDILDFPKGSDIPKSKLPYVKVKGAVLLRLLFETQLKYKLNIIWAGSERNAWEITNCIFKRFYESR